MTKTYCTACACYKSAQTKRNKKGIIVGCRIIRECTHPKGKGKLDSPRTPDWCPLEIKKRFTVDNSVVRYFNKEMSPLHFPTYEAVKNG